MTDEPIEEVSAKIAGQEIHARGFRLSGVITVIAAFAAALAAVLIGLHITDSNRIYTELANAIKEQTKVQREQIAIMREANCLMSSRDADLCARMGKIQ